MNISFRHDFITSTDLCGFVWIKRIHCTLFDSTYLKPFLYLVILTSSFQFFFFDILPVIDNFRLDVIKMHALRVRDTVALVNISGFNWPTCCDTDWFGWPPTSCSVLSKGRPFHQLIFFFGFRLLTFQVPNLQWQSWFLQCLDHPWPFLPVYVHYTCLMAEHTFHSDVSGALVGCR